ncbi:hypothetical protein [Streptomyces sp. NPDC058092]|uniref:hypothetical protein n=1 Tax=Streptomyces sp. NPDC058092 TaxID=3346336 RepID=UPI0036E82AA9
MARAATHALTPRLPHTDRAAITQGYAGVYSSFLLHAERAGERYGVPAREILRRVGEAGYVGGQEDVIIDVTLQLVAERERGAVHVRAGDSAQGPARCPWRRSPDRAQACASTAWE